MTTGGGSKSSERFFLDNGGQLRVQKSEFKRAIEGGNQLSVLKEAMIEYFL